MVRSIVVPQAGLFLPSIPMVHFEQQGDLPFQQVDAVGALFDDHGAGHPGHGHGNIRCQAMEATELSGSQAFEMAFIECQGLAAWIAADWSHPSAAENASTPHLLGDLVPVLADLVLGEREESANG